VTGDRVLNEYEPGTAFPGVIGRTTEESSPAWPRPLRANAGSPNVRGGTTDPFLVHWPQGIRSRGEVRSQYAHIVDMVPTVLDALGLKPPTAIRAVTQSPLHGVSFAHTLE
jgi:arylsulfatase A-like enzyme